MTRERSVTWMHSEDFIKSIKHFSTASGIKGYGRTVEFLLSCVKHAIKGNEAAKKILLTYFNFFGPSLDVQETIHYVLTQLNSSSFRDGLKQLSREELKRLRASLLAHVDMIEEMMEGKKE